MATKNGDCVYKSESLKKMVFPRVFATPVIHENIIYVVGGCDQMGTPVDNFEMYDITKKKWSTLQNLPTKRAAPAVGVVGDKIVAVGGVGDAQQPVDAVEVYSITEKKWTEMEKLPSGLLGMSTVIKDDKVLLMGGMGTDTNPVDYFRMIDVVENKWKELKPMPTPRYATFSFLVNDKLYVIGGRQGKEPCLAFEVYDFAEDSWRKLPNILSKRVFAMYTATDKHIFSIGGLIQPGTQGFSDTCEIFDLEKEEWRNGQNLPNKRGDFAIGVIEGKVVCAGGLGLLERLANGGTITVAEGYLWEFERRGFVKPGMMIPEVVLEKPDEVKILHEEFALAGSDVIEAFTYFGHRSMMKEAGREADLEKLNKDALMIAREVADKYDKLLAGGLCNSLLYCPHDPETHAQTYDMFKACQP